jgi:hypothetical protein
MCSTWWPRSRAAWTRAQPAATAAAAGQALGGGDLGVADLAGRTQRAAQHPAAGHDADPDTRRGLHEQQVAVPLEVAAPLGERHHVGVVVDEHRRPGQHSQERRQLDAVPAGHDRRVEAGSPLEVDGAGDRQPHRADVARLAPDLVQQAAEPGHDLRHQVLRGRPHRLVQVHRDEHRAVEVADPELGAAATDGPGEHHPGVPVEAQVRGGTARRGALLAHVRALDDQPGVEQRREPGRDRRPRQPGEPADVAAGEHATVPDQGEDLPDRGGTGRHGHDGH